MHEGAGERAAYEVGDLVGAVGQARRAGVGGAAVWEDAPWMRLASAGILLFIAALVATALLGGDSIEGTYVAPHMVDGKIVPGEVR